MKSPPDRFPFFLPSRLYFDDQKKTLFQFSTRPPPRPAGWLDDLFQIHPVPTASTARGKGGLCDPGTQLGSERGATCDASTGRSIQSQVPVSLCVSERSTLYGRVQAKDGLTHPGHRALWQDRCRPLELSGLHQSDQGRRVSTGDGKQRGDLWRQWVLQAHVSISIWILF